MGGLLKHAGSAGSEGTSDDSYEKTSSVVALKMQSQVRSCRSVILGSIHYSMDVALGWLLVRITG